MKANHLLNRLYLYVKHYFVNIDPLVGFFALKKLITSKDIFYKKYMAKLSAKCDFLLLPMDPYSSHLCIKTNTINLYAT